MNTASEPDKTVPSSPGAKRERQEKEEGQQVRRVFQRVEKRTSDNAKRPSMKDLVSTDLHSDSVVILKKTLNILCRNLEDNENTEDTRKQFVKLGGLVKVVRVMNNHPTCKSIQEDGINLLLMVAYETKDYVDEVPGKEGIQAILAAMKRFESDSNMQFCGLKALYNLVWDDKLHESNVEYLILVLKGAPYLLQVLTQFIDDECVVYEACELLRVLCLPAALREPIFEAGAVIVLATVINTYNTACLIRKSASEAMASLMQYSIETL